MPDFVSRIEKPLLPRISFAEPGLTGRAVDRFPHDGGVVDHHDKDENGRNEREAFEKDRERIGRIETPEAGRRNVRGRGREKETGGEDGRETEDSRESQSAFVDPLEERFDQKHEQAYNEHFNFESRGTDRHHCGVK